MSGLQMARALGAEAHRIGERFGNPGDDRELKDAAKAVTVKLRDVRVDRDADDFHETLDIIHCARLTATAVQAAAFTRRDLRADLAAVVALAVKALARALRDGRAP